jgi:hypothetical protein
MDAQIPPEYLEQRMMREDELDRLLAIEVACECLLAHAERLERLAAAENAELRAA